VIKIKPGIFTLIYRLITKIPEIFRWVFDMLPNMEGSMLTQCLVLVGVCVILPPLVDAGFWLYEKIFIPLLDRTAK